MITSISAEELSAHHPQSPRFFHVTTDIDGRCLSANDLFKSKFGIDVQQIFTQAFAKSISPDHATQYYKAIEACTRLRSVMAVELRHRLPDIEDFPIYWEVSFVPAENGQAQYFQWTGMYMPDNDEKKKKADQLKQSESFFRALIADSLDGMLLINEIGTISFASASVENILGYQPEELVGKNSFDFVHADDMELCVSAFRDELNQDPQRKFIGIRLLQKSGEWLWCMVRGHNQLFNPAVGQNAYLLLR